MIYLFGRSISVASQTYCMCILLNWNLFSISSYRYNYVLQIDAVNIIPEDTHEPVFNAAQHSLSDVSHVLPVGLDIGLVYQDLVVNFTDLDAESTPILSTGTD